MEKYYIITFKNTHEAMNGEKISKQNNIKIQVIPTPTSITKSCGISLKVYENNFEKINQLICENKIEIKNVYVKEKNTINVVK